MSRPWGSGGTKPNSRRIADGLRLGLAGAQRRYTCTFNFREGWRGHLWQGRFASFVLDEPFLLTAARYVELNPVRAGLVTVPSRYRWSGAASHSRGKAAEPDGSRQHTAYRKITGPSKTLPDFKWCGSAQHASIWLRLLTHVRVIQGPSDKPLTQIDLRPEYHLRSLCIDWTKRLRRGMGERPRRGVRAERRSTLGEF